MYRQWPREHNGVEFLAVELPGRESRFSEPHFGTFQQLAEMMAEGLAPHLDVPFAFFGHCSSALAAYEVSAHLVRAGLPAPARLFASSQVAPQDGPVSRFLTMDDAALGAELTSMFQAAGATPAPELLEIYVMIMRRDVDANRQYVLPDPTRLPCPITAIGWAHDHEVPFSTMGGWSRCGETTSVLLDGDHRHFMTGPDELLDLLSSELAPRA